MFVKVSILQKTSSNTTSNSTRIRLTLQHAQDASGTTRVSVDVISISVDVPSTASSVSQAYFLYEVLSMSSMEGITEPSTYESVRPSYRILIFLILSSICEVSY